jgi:hypothetical protein
MHLSRYIQIVPFRLLGGIVRKRRTMMANKECRFVNIINGVLKALLKLMSAVHYAAFQATNLKRNLHSSTLSHGKSHSPSMMTRPLRCVLAMNADGTGALVVVDHYPSCLLRKGYFLLHFCLLRHVVPHTTT